MSRQHLGDHIADKMRERNESGVGVALDLDIPVTTLKSWLQRNSYPVEGLKLLAERYRLPVGIPDLQQRFDFKIARTYAKPGKNPAPADIVDVAQGIDLDRSVEFGPSHWSFIERQTEKEALLFLRMAAKGEVNIPIAIIGGARTGKSTALRYLRHNAYEHTVIQPDFSKLDRNTQTQASAAEQIVEQIDEAVLEGFPDAPRLRDLRLFPKWFSRIKANLIGKSRVLLIFDGLEHLASAHFNAIATLLHHFKNGAEQYSELREVDIAYSMDRTVLDFEHKQTVASRFLGTYGMLVDCRAIPERAVFGLIETALKQVRTDPTEIKSLANTLTTEIFDDLCHGHPWLVQCCLSTILNSPPDVERSDLHQLVKDDFQQHLEKLVSGKDPYCRSEPHKLIKQLVDGLRDENYAFKYDRPDRAEITAPSLFATSKQDTEDNPNDKPVNDENSPDVLDFQKLRQSLLFYDHEPDHIFTTKALASFFVRESKMKAEATASDAASTSAAGASDAAASPASPT